MKKVTAYIRSRKAAEPEPFCAHLYDLQSIQAHVADRVATLPAPCRLFYAIKANSDLPILQALLPHVHGFEVASLGEVRKVRAVSQEVPILFGGPGKTDEEIHGAIEHRVTLLHVESLHELRRAAYIAEQRGVTLPILLRVNLRGPLPSATLAMAGRPTQFGIDEARIPEAIQLAQSLPALDLQGFHLHSLSNNLDATAHVELVAYYCRRVREWAEAYGVHVRYLNAGGGIGVNYAALDEQFDWGSFVGALGPMLEREALPDMTVFFECGRYLTAHGGWYAVEVLDIKQNHGKTYAIVRGGTHQFRLPVSWQHSHPFQVLSMERWDYPFARTEITDTPITVVGQLCTPKDVLATDITVPRLRIGDVIVFQYTGAYGWAISHHDFLSHPHADLVYLDGTEEL
ncbi:type III PLP-dependent enzyme [Tumebacillus permanentifrigoris]|uniref:Diaminopimelate decarboxylase n=1 Tax=Tumebacillus permanentifrigoris TaxID=378543 RepID=A0A316D694_9BACL|nr:type III PLP-dependent enzyme [Tumebacillus permanentifrigoris]PWK09624.1 diaminopimelate decarboxylase [Tumebacillus permanentifrigoris]